MNTNILTQINTLNSFAKTITIIFITYFFVANSAVASEADSSIKNPIYGKWLLAESHCTMTYRFHQNGTMITTEGPEILESRFTINKNINSNRFYYIEYTITKTNGRMGCDSEGLGGEYEDMVFVGLAGVIYVYFEQNKNKMFVCPEPKIDNGCAGPFMRVSQ